MSLLRQGLTQIILISKISIRPSGSLSEDHLSSPCRFNSLLGWTRSGIPSSAQVVETPDGVQKLYIFTSNKVQPCLGLRTFVAICCGPHTEKLSKQLPQKTNFGLVGGQVFNVASICFLSIACLEVTCWVFSVCSVLTLSVPPQSLLEFCPPHTALVPCRTLSARSSSVLCLAGIALKPVAETACSRRTSNRWQVDGGKDLHGRVSSTAITIDAERSQRASIQIILKPLPLLG
eukprot:5351436-Amphidinium_carterae.1